ncbi:hypothetical protein NM688_g5234 [Phlebia brevispora]|uniref:Uncharacterized protein n=1 Tax=Phlebia brevispora TaxID=194682 RepID=A0ACC1SYL7_9APHY|nr:hypothetical protein NM688_g5234 [Phlebia brevispora]
MQIRGSSADSQELAPERVVVVRQRASAGREELDRDSPASASTESTFFLPVMTQVVPAPWATSRWRTMEAYKMQVISFEQLHHRAVASGYLRHWYTSGELQYLYSQTLDNQVRSQAGTSLTDFSFREHLQSGIPNVPERATSSKWSSRDSRKNRCPSGPVQVHVLEDGDDERAASREKTPPTAVSIALEEQRLRHPNSSLKVHLSLDVSFWVAIAFVVGSAAWIANGFILYLPLSPTPIEDQQNAAAAMAFIGGTCFEIGGYLAYVESLNTEHEELFGQQLRGLFEGSESRRVRNEKSQRSDYDAGEDTKPRKFRWIGLGSFRELGFLASFIQFLAASIFWISTLTGLPGIIPDLVTDPPTAIADIFYWTPQIIGGTGFITASLLLMLEVQSHWWLPNLRSLGWHVGVWNLVGALGFTMCGALGYASIASTKADYQSVMSTFWGSFAFMIGSCVQLWEALWRESTDSVSSSSE